MVHTSDIVGIEKDYKKATKNCGALYQRLYGGLCGRKEIRDILKAKGKVFVP